MDATTFQPAAPRTDRLLESPPRSEARMEGETAGLVIAPATPPVYVALQYWRGIAALMVVYFHAAIQASERGAEALPLIGRSGVDIFFVLSGFVMWTSTRGRPMSPVTFLKRRIARIVPLYWLVTLTTAAIALVAPSVLRSTSFDLRHLLASLAFVPWPSPRALGAGIEDRIAPLVIPGWSLNFEMLFYLLFAVALLVPLRQRLAALALLILATLVIALLTASHSVAAEFYGQGLLLEFLAGALIGRVASSHLRITPGAAAIIVGAGFALLLVMDWARPEIDRATALGPAAAAIVFGTVMLERSGSVPFVRWLDALGNASYSIYLTHVFVVAGLRTIVLRSGLGDVVMVTAFVPACLIVSAVVGYGSYRLVELPLVAGAKRLLRA